MSKVSDHEYLYIKCQECNDRVKIAKNDGSYWKTGYPSDWLGDFLLLHGDCSELVLEAADD